ncbi:YceI family protein [Imperialibacter roseus]|uniref:YceI family protein n=1 Tax=Imperialibacter roseus TaxID=1324217 RepID=A0ABZ0ISP6_9BACT|nr:YceI family protein [Imperialibacter roseus]WOK07616.1 YceI family protein [Imperialibacter roseus]|tara:strand:- start:20882 stop:21466 length:585 start_codon:yes stop_codon:yes gene_type:complete
MLSTIFTSLVLLVSNPSADDTKAVYKVSTVESKVVWTGEKLAGTHTGTINLSQGDLQFDGDKLTGGSFTIDMNSIVDTDLEGEYKGKLEGHLKSDDFFGVATYPTATFKITSVKSTGKNKYDVSGDITIKGTTEKITFPAELVVNGSKVTATSKITVDRSKFNVKYGSKSFFAEIGDKVIYDEFVLDVTLVAAK